MLDAMFDAPHGDPYASLKTVRWWHVVANDLWDKLVPCNFPWTIFFQLIDSTESAERDSDVTFMKRGVGQFQGKAWTLITLIVTKSTTKFEDSSFLQNLKGQKKQLRPLELQLPCFGVGFQAFQVTKLKYPLLFFWWASWRFGKMPHVCHQKSKTCLVHI